jgi:ElaB/YqjD/DUF883 family membrane-anchored ribosome-binding protein
VDDELEVIRDQMEETRASLADKIEALENQVLGTVHTATDTVTSAVEGAKEVVSSVTEGAKEVVDKVSETVETVKEKLSVSRYVEQYPWASLGVAVAAGFAAGQLLPSARSLTTSRAGTYSAASAASAYQPQPAQTAQSGAWSGALKGVWETAATTVEGLAVGTLMSAIKELVARNLPHEWQGELTRMVDDMTTRLGGKVMQGNPLQELLSAFSSGQDDQQNRSASTPAASGQATNQGIRT